MLPAQLTAIGEYCFEDCSSLTSLTIPAPVKSIGPGAFAGCRSLADIQVDEKNEKYSAHDGMLFSSEGKTLNCYPSAKGVVNNLPDSLTIIGDGSFAGTAITRLILPESVMRFGSACFNGCEELTMIVPQRRKAPSCLTGNSSGTFAGLDCDKVQVIIPVGTEASYCVADGWKLFSNVSLFKAFGKAGVQGFSSSKNIDLDGIIVVDNDFEASSDEVSTVDVHRVGRQYLVRTATCNAYLRDRDVVGISQTHVVDVGTYHNHDGIAWTVGETSPEFLVVGGSEREIVLRELESGFHQ